jgi:hypothetical protein
VCGVFGDARSRVEWKKARGNGLGGTGKGMGLELAIAVRLVIRIFILHADQINWHSSRVIATIKFMFYSWQTNSYTLAKRRKMAKEGKRINLRIYMLSTRIIYYFHSTIELLVL